MLVYAQLPRIVHMHDQLLQCITPLTFSYADGKDINLRRWQHWQQQGYLGNCHHWQRTMP